ncbi:MAG: hypothetical protein PHQ91_14700 [Thermoanaerobaculaceae bacterium]|nr:hypothetical protein [Thermoanaerobaculaceae bacterium]TAM44130.1 MAG: hypothetical protein EPN53_16950 [Acidobacteriota bacterium]
MKKRVLAVFAVAVMAAAAGAYQNEEPGFRGHEWGMSPPPAWGLPVETDPTFGGIRLYEDPEDSPKLGCAKLESVEYGFWQGRLSDVRVAFRGLDNYKCILDTFTEKFDSGTQPNKSVEHRLWVGGVTAIVLHFDPVGKVGYVTLVSKGILNEQRAWERAQAKKAAGTP